MAFTSDQYTALEAAYAKGVLTVEYGDQKVTYRSLAEMRSLLKEMGKAVGAKPKWNGRTFVKFKSGL